MRLFDSTGVWGVTYEPVRDGQPLSKPLLDFPNAAARK